MKHNIFGSVIAVVLVLAMVIPSGFALATGSEPDTMETTPLASDPTDGTVPGTSEPSDPEDGSTSEPSEPEGGSTSEPSDPEGGSASEPSDPSEPEVPDEEFSCFTYDDQGHVLKGYWSEKDQLWYLFVTSTQNVADVQLYYTGTVAEVSKGVVDQALGMVSGGFQEAGSMLKLTEEDGTVQSVIVLQSGLPSVYVDLEGTTLTDIHADKDKKHKNNSVYIMDPENNWDLTVENTVEIKGRGNSTWREYEKKAYQIKFDSNTSVMGMGKAKKWVLLANASDDSMMRTQLISRMAQNFDMDFVTSFEYVDLWIEGEYLGNYLLGEKVEPGSSRLDLSDDAGALFEHDEDFYLDEDYWFLSKMLNRHFTLKEIVEEEDEFIQAAMADFEAAVDALTLFLYTTPSEEVTLEKLSEMIDVDSFIKYYLINEYALNRESFSTSFYWYKDGSEDVIHLGPIWDFDTCMGNDGEPNTASYGESHVLFRYLLAAPEFYDRTMELLEVYRPALESMTDEVDEIRKEISESAEMNYLRWDVLGKPNPKGGTDFHQTFDAAADALKEWLAGRESGFRVEHSEVATSVVSEDCRTMTISFCPEAEYTQVMFALWSLENGNDDMNWYRASKTEDGIWQCTIDLGNHNSAGLYYYNVYTDNQQELLATGRNYVETAHVARYDLKAEISDDNRKLLLHLDDTTDALTAVRFDIWGTSVQETSFQRLQAEKDDNGIWTAEVSMCAFNLTEPDNLIVQAHGVEQGVEIPLNERLVPVEKVPTHTYPSDESGPCVICGHVFGEQEFLAKTPMYRLYNPNSGEHFYTGSEVERDYLTSLGWQYEGIAWHAPIFSGAPVYRTMNPNSGDHHYTMSWEEVEMLEEEGWLYEGVCWNSAAEGSTQYRLYNPNADLGSHHYTSSEEERDYLVSLGWIWEGIGWFGIAAE